MAEAIKIDFQIGGIARVQEAFRTIEQITIRAEKAIAKLSDAGTKKRGDNAKATGKAHAKGEEDSVKATARAEQDKLKAAEKAAKERVRNWIKSDKMIIAANKDAAREFDRIEGEKNRSATRWLKKGERDQLESARKVLRARENFARATVGAAGRGLSVGMRAATSATMGVAGSMLSLGGGFSISDSVHRSTAASGMAADIANSGFLPGGSVAANQKKRSTGEILSTTRAAATQYGFTNEEALAGLQKSTGVSGDLTQGMKMLPRLAEIARATGTSLDDISEAAGNVSLSMAGMDGDGEKTLHILRKLAEGGKLGSVEMRNFAKELPKLTSSAGQFAGGANTNLVKLGALAQEARGEGGAFRASVAANSVTGFVTTLKTGARVDALNAAGVNIWADKKDHKKGWRAPEEIIFDSIKAADGDPMKMNQMFKGIMGNRLVQGFANRYNAAGGGKAGETAMRGRMDELMGATDPAALKAQFANDSAERMGSDDMKMAKIMANFDEAVATKLVPKLMELMPVLEKLIPQFVDMTAHAVPSFVKFLKSVGEFADANRAIINGIAEHPIGALIGFEMAKAISGAGLGKVMEKALATNFGQAGGITLASAALAISLGMITIDKLSDDEANKNRAQVALGLGAQQDQNALNAGIRNGTLTPDQIEAAQRRKAQLTGEVAEARKNLGKGNTGFFNSTMGALAKGGDWLSGGVDAVAHQTTGSSSGSFKTNAGHEAEQKIIDAQRVRVEAAERALKDFTDALNESVAALAKPNRTKTLVERN